MKRPTTKTLTRAVAWLLNGETGLSSMTILAANVGIDYDEASWPRDPADLLRCLALLHEFPEFSVEPCANLCPEWAALAARWEEIVVMLAVETDEPGETVNAARTYELMREILRPLEDESGEVIARFGEG